MNTTVPEILILRQKFTIFREMRVLSKLFLYLIPISNRWPLAHRLDWRIYISNGGCSLWTACGGLD